LSNKRIRSRLRAIYPYSLGIFSVRGKVLIAEIKKLIEPNF